MEGKERGLRAEQSLGELLPENPPFSDESSWEKQKGKPWREGASTAGRGRGTPSTTRSHTPRGIAASLQTRPAA